MGLAPLLCNLARSLGCGRPRLQIPGSPRSCSSRFTGPGLTGRTIGVGWSSDTITEEGRRQAGLAAVNPSVPAHATSGRTWLVASQAAELRRRNPGSGSGLGSDSLDLTRSSRPAQESSDWLLACLLPGERSSGRPSNAGPLCPSVQLPPAAELASIGESQSRESLSFTSPSSECASAQASREWRFHLEPMDPEPAAASTLGWRGTDNPASGNREMRPGPLSLSSGCCVYLSGFVSFTVPEQSQKFLLTHIIQRFECGNVTPLFRDYFISFCSRTHTDMALPI